MSYNPDILNKDHPAMNALEHLRISKQHDKEEFGDRPLTGAEATMAQMSSISRLIKTVENQKYSITAPAMQYYLDDMQLSDLGFLVDHLLRYGQLTTAEPTETYRLLSKIELPGMTILTNEEELRQRIMVAMSYLRRLANEGEARGFTELFGTSHFHMQCLLLCCGTDNPNPTLEKFMRFLIPAMLRITGPQFLEVKHLFALSCPDYSTDVTEIDIVPSKELSDYFEEHPSDFAVAMFLLLKLFSTKVGTRAEGYAITNLLIAIAAAGRKDSTTSLFPKDYIVPKIICDADTVKKYADNYSLSYTEINRASRVLRGAKIGSTVFVLGLTIIPESGTSPDMTVPADDNVKPTELPDIKDITVKYLLPSGNLDFGSLLSQCFNTRSSYRTYAEFIAKQGNFTLGLQEILSESLYFHSDEDRSRCMRLGVIKMCGEFLSTNKGCMSKGPVKGHIIRNLQDSGLRFRKISDGTLRGTKVRDSKLFTDTTDMYSSPGDSESTYSRLFLMVLTDIAAIENKENLDSLGRIRILCRVPHSKYIYGTILMRILHNYMKKFFTEEFNLEVNAKDNLFNVMLDKLVKLKVLSTSVDTVTGYTKQIYCQSPLDFHNVTPLTINEMKNMLYLMRISTNRHGIVESYGRIASSRLAFESEIGRIDTISLRMLMITIHLLGYSRDVEHVLMNTRRIFMGSAAIANKALVIQMHKILSQDIEAWILNNAIQASVATAESEARKLEDQTARIPTTFSKDMLRLGAEMATKQNREVYLKAIAERYGNAQDDDMDEKNVQGSNFQRQNNQGSTNIDNSIDINVPGIRHGIAPGTNVDSIDRTGGNVQNTSAVLTTADHSTLFKEGVLDNYSTYNYTIHWDQDQKDEVAGSDKIPILMSYKDSLEYIKMHPITIIDTEKWTNDYRTMQEQLCPTLEEAGILDHLEECDFEDMTYKVMDLSKILVVVTEVRIYDKTNIGDSLRQEDGKYIIKSMGGSYLYLGRIKRSDGSNDICKDFNNVVTTSLPSGTVSILDGNLLAIYFDHLDCIEQALSKQKSLMTSDA